MNSEVKYVNVIRGVDINTGELRPSYKSSPGLYKNTIVGFVDKGWEVVQLNQVCDMKSGDGITSQSIKDVGDYPVYGGNGLRGYTNTYTHEGDYVLIGRQGALCGNITNASGKFFASEHAVVVSTTADIDVKWLSYCLNEMRLNRYSEASAQPGLSVAKILRLSIPKPQLTEQTLVSKILSTIDGQIEKTEAIIAKYQAVKQGMLQDLFTRGIDVNTGELRPKHEDAPELYKDSPLGMIPKEWEVDKYSNAFEIINGGTPSTSKKEYWDGEIPWLSVEDFNNDRRYVNKAIKSISKEGLKNSSTNLLHKGMIIISARGTVGVIAQLETSMAFNQSCYGLNSTNNKISNDFGYYFLKYYKAYFGFNSFGSVFSTITRSYFDNIHFAYPKNELEMAEIVKRIALTDDLRQNERSSLHKLKKVKQGLMSDLLSGKVEVTI